MSIQLIPCGSAVRPMVTNGSPALVSRVTRSSSNRISMRITPSTRRPVTIRSNDRSWSPPEGDSSTSRSWRAAASTTLATKPSCMSVNRWLAGGMTSPRVRVRPSFRARALAFGR